MKRTFYIVLVALCTTPIISFSQRYKLPEDPAEFAPAVQELLNGTRDDRGVAAGEDLALLWGGLGIDVQRKIIAHAQLLDQKNYRAKPYFIQYFAALSNAVNIESLDNQKLVNYLNVTGKVIENYENKHLLIYLNTVKDFFEYRSLHYSKYSQIQVSNDTYDFEYVAFEPPPEEVVPEPIEEEEESIEEESDDWFDEWEEEPAEDDWGSDWGDEEESWDTEEAEEQAEEEEDLSFLIQDVIQPPIAGAVIKFNSTDLAFITPRDSVSAIHGTSGSFLIKEGIFVGENGKFDWAAADLSPDSVYVNFTKYNFEVSKGALSAERVHLTYKGKLESPVEGVFEFNGKVRNNNEYPRFMSYYNNIDVKGIGDEFLEYKGGFSLNGNRILSSSIFGGLATIRVSDAAGPKFVSRSNLYEFGDSTLTADKSSIVIFHKSDSLYHPAVQINYDHNNRHLLLQKDKGGFKRTPYKSSFFNMDFIADMIQWNLDSSYLDVSILNARKEVPAYFESVEYFDNKEVSGSIGLYDFNPLRMVMGYAKKNSDQFLAVDLAESTRRPLATIKSAMLYLMWAGYIDYNVKTTQVTIKEKAYHALLSQKSKKDFDNLKIESLTDSKPNATLDFNTQEMHVRGIDRFYISEILDVYIEPDSNEVTLLKNRDFKFNGKIFAGNFEYVGHDFTFKYDSFLVQLNHIDSIRFYVLEEDSRGSRKRLVDNALSGIGAGGEEEGDSAAVDNNLSGFQGTSGTLYINRPNNKSARKIYPDYPKFDGGGTGSIVYFDRPDYLDGIYDKSIYFVIPPFKLDSLSDSDPAAIGFNGTFGSSGMFPEFKETLNIQPDYALGFEHSIPPDGYHLFDGEGKLFNRLTMDKRGLRADGKIEYLTTTLNSNDFIFYVDSVVTRGSVVDIAEGEYRGAFFPKIHLEDYSLKWLPRKDSMYISNNADPIQLYENTASLDGSAIVGRKGVFGQGLLTTRGAETVSREYEFKSNEFTAGHAHFVVKSSDPEKPTIEANNVKLSFNLTDNFAEINPEVAGEAVLDFPFAQFKTSIPSAVWDLDSAKVTMTKPEEYDIADSYFYTTREDLDSLSFNATEAIYDINSQELTVSGIPYITVADSRITPENGEVLILENAKIGTLQNTTLVIDTLDSFHRLYDGTITIISRNEFEGEATYEYVNAVQDTFAIKLTDFHLEDLSENKKRPDFHTVADGNIEATDNIIVSPGMFYKGTVKMYANRPFLELDGFVKLNLKKIPNYDTWIKYQHDGEQGEVVFDFEESVTEDGQQVTAGLHYNINDFSLYSTFITQKPNSNDEDFFIPSGMLSYQADSSEFVIAEQGKIEGDSYSGKVFAFNEDTGDIRIEGPVNFIQNTKSRGIDAAILGEGNIETNEFSFNSFISILFDLPPSAFELVAQDLNNSIDEYGAPEAEDDRTQLLYKVAEIIGDRAVENYETRSAQEYTPLVTASPALVKPMVFSNVDLKWSHLNKAFYSVGNLSMSNVLRNDINAAFEGFFEVTKKLEGEKIDLFFKASAETWYYFGYENNRLITFSSNKEYNEFITSKSNAAKAKVGDFVFVPGDLAEALDFVNRFRKDYLNLETPYELYAPLGDEEKKEEKKDAADDDEGF